MIDYLGLILQLVGFTLASAGYVWLLHRAFAANQLWGTLIFFLPPLALVYILLSLRRSWAPLLVMLLGGAVVAAPYGIKYYQRTFVDLGERLKVVEGEDHVTLTGWDKTDYGLLERLPDTVVLQMANSEVTDETLKHLEGMTRLQELDLNDTQVTDAGLKLIAKLPKLERLRLRNTKITDAGFRECLMPLELLRKVDMTGTAVKGSTLRQWRNAQKGREYLN
jgi:Leucine Rich repeats (2 copies)